MRFSELRLLRYGHFQDCSLSFPKGECDLQIIVGPNEAGKSTSLAAVSDLLFGFKPRTRFAFRFDQKLLRIGAMLEAEGRVIELSRRKGTGETLSGPDDQPIGEAVLGAMLGGQTRDSFRRMFGLDHAQLRAGGEQIVRAEDDIGAAIFAAGSGIVQVARVCEELEAEAKAIWAKGAGETRRYTAALGAFQQAKADLKAAEVRPATWARARKDLDTAEAELQVLGARRASISKNQRDLQRKQMVLGPSTRRAAALTKLEQVGLGPRLTDEDAAACESALLERHTAEIDLANATTEIERLTEDLGTSKPDVGILDLTGEIDALREAKGVVDQGRLELPGLTARREHAWVRASEMARELGWAGSDASSLQRQLPSRAVLAVVREFFERRVGIDEQARGAREGVREAESARKTLEGKLGAMAPSADMRAVQELLRDLRAGGLTQALEHASNTAAELQRVLSSRLRELAPWKGETAALRSLPFPAAEDMELAFDRLDRARERVELEQEGERREAERLDELQLQLRHAALAHPAPTQEALEAARGARDSVWSSLKAHLLGRSPLSDVVAPVESFDRAVQASDRLADERFAFAEHAGALAALEREIEKSELENRQVGNRLVRAKADVDAAYAAFGQLIAPLGVALSPEAYAGWRDACLSALEAADAVQIATEEYERAQQAERDASQSLLRTLGREADDPTAEQPLARLLTEAERLIEKSNEARIQEEALRAELRSAEDVLSRSQSQLQAADDAEARWLAGWQPALTDAGIDPSSSIASIRVQLEVIDELRGALAAIVELDNRLQVIRQTTVAFEERIQKTAIQVGLSRVDAESAFQALQKMHADEQAKSQRHTSLSQALSKAKEARRLALRQLDFAASVLARLDGWKAGENGLSDREALEKAREANRLHVHIDELEGEILEAGEGRGIAILVGEVAEADAGDLAAAVGDLQEQLESLTNQIEVMRETRRSAEIAFAAVDDRPDAAIAAAKIAAARSEMAFQAELYIRKRAEVRLLRTAIERYRQEKQGPLLSRASSLFAALTLGRFSRLIVDYDGDKPSLGGVRSGGDTVVPVDGMSEGTVDQLYLALRVAAVEDAVTNGVRLPFLADDLFINFDDERAAAGFKVLAELARSTQVLFFTHHEHLVQVANRALAPAKVSVCGLDRQYGRLLVPG